MCQMCQVEPNLRDLAEVDHVALLAARVIERRVPILGVVAEEVALRRLVEYEVARHP